ncbi:MAG: DNA internalization-related competence protein ComEC/Rec2 [Vicinamibacterales bacterium]
MVPVGLFPALAFVLGAACGSSLDIPRTNYLLPAGGFSFLALVCGGLGGCADGRRWFRCAALPCVLLAAWSAGAHRAAAAREQALETPLRTALNHGIGGFRIEDLSVPGEHDPVPTRAVIAEDAARSEQFTSLRVWVREVRLHGAWRVASGGVTLGIGGGVPPAMASEWRAGRTIEVPVTYRRPATYLNDGVTDFERDLAFDGTTLFGSVKSGLLIDVTAHGTAVEEIAARARLQVRRSSARWVARHDGVSSAIVTAILIGDRSGLPDDIRLRLQAAGTYHVIAISGGNIAILAAVSFGLLTLGGGAGRLAAFGTLLVLAGYAQVVAGGPSVWRATLMAMLYLIARLFDHRSPPWQAMAVAAAVATYIRPLEVRDAGFLLTFGATAALLEVARRASTTVAVDRGSGLVRRAKGVRSAGLRWLAAATVASLAVEIALLPIGATTFSRVTSAGLVLNLLAVPLMAVTQVAGMLAVAIDATARIVPGPRHALESAAWLAGWLANIGAVGLVSSARLVEVAPWLTARVPAPSPVLVMTYYAALGLALLRPGVLRRAALAVLAIATLAIVTGTDPLISAWRRVQESPRNQPQLRLTMFDVGQAESMLLEFPDRSTLMIDAGGSPFGRGAFDIGGRVLAPALWARGVRSLGALLLTHGDPDHIGGAASLLSDFAPAALWEGIAVPSHPGLRALHEAARREGTALSVVRAGQSRSAGRVRVRVLHPPSPDWERQKVRNDDSVILEVVHGEVAVLLTGDAGAEVERAIVPLLTPARVRVLKVGHHGSRTSTSGTLLNSWRPTIALISAGRDNRFGHPAADVVARLQQTGTRIYRTDRDGQITLTTDGRDVRVRTFTGQGP